MDSAKNARWIIPFKKFGIKTVFIDCLFQNGNNQTKNKFRPSNSNGLTEKLQRNGSIPTVDEQFPVVSLPKEHRRMLRNIERHFEASDNEENVREDWQRLARILDKVCLLLYITCFAVVTLIYVLKLVSRGDDSTTRS